MTGKRLGYAVGLALLVAFPFIVAALFPQGQRYYLHLAIQILLGGWTSSNYAAIACPERLNSR